MELTPSQTVGPFFSLGLTTGKCSVGKIAGPKAKGEHIRLICRVLDGDGVGVPDAVIEIWQADAQGKYRHPDDPQGVSADPECRGFGRLASNEDGNCEFETILPGRVPGPDGSQQAPHLNLAIFARGMLRQLYTRIYIAGDQANDKDPVLVNIPAERRETLMATSTKPGVWYFEIRLQAERETVFFDI